MKASRTRLIHPAEIERKMASLGDRFTLIQKGEAIRREEILRRWCIAKRGGWELGMTAVRATGV
jgi:hypothetical protein